MLNIFTVAKLRLLTDPSSWLLAVMLPISLRIHSSGSTGQSIGTFLQPMVITVLAMVRSLL